MINIPLTPFAFQFLFHDAISFHHVKGTLVKPQNSAQLLFSLDFSFSTGQEDHIHNYVVLTFLISTNGNLTFVHFFSSVFHHLWSSLMRSHPMYLFVCAMNASDQ
jgi:hypothetical protein